MDSVGPLVAILALLVLVPVFWFVATANRIVKLRNHIRESWANVDVVLKRRYDLIPNLVETVKAYAAHEREVLERVVAARNQAASSVGDVGQQARDESQMVREVNTLLARSEAYPQLRSSANFLALQNELVNTEDRIAAARRFYNANVRDYNTLIDSFPASIVAGMQNAAPAEFFEVEDLAIRRGVQVDMG